LRYTYPPQFPQPSRARIAAVTIQAGLDLENAKRELRSLADLESAVRHYILRVFDAFATEALELGRRGVWALEGVDREANEFLASVTIEAQFRKGRDQHDQSISPLVDRVFGEILTEVRREFENSVEWRRYQEGLLEVALAQASNDTPASTSPNGGGNTEDLTSVVPRKPIAGRLNKASSIRARSWEEVEIAFLSDERIQVWIDGRPKTYNYAEFGCIDARSERPNKAWEMLRTLAAAEGVMPATARLRTSGWSAMEKQIGRLRVVLKEHFNLDEYPLPYDSGSGYQARFRIRLAESFDK